MQGKAALLIFATVYLCGLATATNPHSTNDHDREVARRGLDVAPKNAAVISKMGRRHRKSAKGSKREGKTKACGGSKSSSSQSTPAQQYQPSNQTSSGAKSDSVTSKNDSLATLSSLGITGFQGENGPAIGSFFHTDSAQDSTNGMSWCQLRYTDTTNGFAPDVTVMLNDFGGDYEKATKAYCGLEAIVTTPNGNSKTMYIVDGFDHQWVRTPGSIDIVKNDFVELYGKDTENKNDVIQGITWRLTGNRNDSYKFRGTA